MKIALLLSLLHSSPVVKILEKSLINVSGAEVTTGPPRCS